jgi:TonB family protein
MRDRIASGEASGDLLAVALLFRAIGEAGLNQESDAAWDFGVAQAMYPPYEKVDLKPYAGAGEFLDEHRYRNGAPPGDPVDLAAVSVAGNVVRPRKIKVVPAEYPLAKRASCQQKVVVVRTVIDEHGQTVHPSLPTPTDPVLALAAFDAVRHWVFEPATRNGQPIAVGYVITVSFKIRGC